MQVTNVLIQDGVDQPLGNGAPPTPLPALQRSQVGIAESTGMKTAQPIPQPTPARPAIRLRNGPCGFASGGTS